MKVTLINKADTGGGAPVAGHRLLQALRSAGTDATLLVQHKNSPGKHVVGTAVSKLDLAISEVDFLRERVPFILKERDRSVRFAFSTANTGRSLIRHPDVMSADILHLHWTNFGFLSVRNLEELFRTGKPIVWTLHDMWAFTGGCHYSAGCTHFYDSCGNCPMLQRPRPNDISHQGWLRKKLLYDYADRITFVGCSNWMQQMAAKSTLLRDFRIESIANPIDPLIFAPRDPAAARKNYGIGADEKVILFGAANINDRRKGIRYLIDALHLLKETNDGQLFRIVLFGKNKLFDTSELPFPVIALPVVRSDEELVRLYTIADVFIQPSLEDNLPNMVMEAMACGTPVVAFDTGGLPDMINHQVNGYLATYKSPQDLAAGIRWVVRQGEELKQNARQKVLHSFQPAKIAEAYRQLYQQLLNEKGR